jgi:hypothetical protein
VGPTTALLPITCGGDGATDHGGDGGDGGDANAPLRTSCGHAARCQYVDTGKAQAYSIEVVRIGRARLDLTLRVDEDGRPVRRCGRTIATGDRAPTSAGQWAQLQILPATCAVRDTCGGM